MYLVLKMLMGITYYENIMCGFQSFWHRAVVSFHSTFPWIVWSALRALTNIFDLCKHCVVKERDPFVSSVIVSEEWDLSFYRVTFPQWLRLWKESMSHFSPKITEWSQPWGLFANITVLRKLPSPFVLTLWPSSKILNAFVASVSFLEKHN